MKAGDNIQTQDTINIQNTQRDWMKCEHGVTYTLKINRETIKRANL